MNGRRIDSLTLAALCLPLIESSPWTSWDFGPRLLTSAYTASLLYTTCLDCLEITDGSERDREAQRYTQFAKFQATYCNNLFFSLLEVGCLPSRAIFYVLSVMYPRLSNVALYGRS